MTKRQPTQEHKVTVVSTRGLTYEFILTNNSELRIQSDSITVSRPRSMKLISRKGCVTMGDEVRQFEMKRTYLREVREE